MVARTKVPLNDLGRLSNEEEASIMKQVREVLRSGVFINGANVKTLENTVGTFLGGRSAIGLSSGSDALYIALRALGIGVTHKVATVANAAGYGTNAILRCGATPILVDIDPATAQMSVDSLERVLEKTPNIQGVIVTHLYGLMGHIEELLKLCQHYGCLLVEDCAQAFGAERYHRPAGSWGDAATFSFYPTKNLAALGDGGLVAFRDSAICARARVLAQYGWSSRYEVSLLDGINARLDEIQAAILLSRLDSVHQRNSYRRDILRRYYSVIPSSHRLIFEDSKGCVAHLAALCSTTREQDRMTVSRRGIETSIHYPIPDHRQLAWKNLFAGTSLPNTEKHCAEVFTIPCFPELTGPEIDRVCEVLQLL